MIAAVALTVGASETYFRVRPMLFGPEVPIVVDVNAAETRRIVRADGKAETWYRFDGEVKMVCGQQTFERRLVDTVNDEVKAPIVIRAPGAVTRFFTAWLPVGRFQDLLTVIEEEPGRQGKLFLFLSADQCPNGYRGTYDVYQLPYNWIVPPDPSEGEWRRIEHPIP